MEQEEKRQDVRTLVLAAGRGTRMRSKRPKVLHELCGRTMLGYAENLAAHLGDAPPLVVVGQNAEAVRAALGDEAATSLEDPVAFVMNTGLDRIFPER